MKNLRIHVLCIDQHREKKVVGEAGLYPQLIGKQSLLDVEEVDAGFANS